MFKLRLEIWAFQQLLRKFQHHPKRHNFYFVGEHSTCIPSSLTVPDFFFFTLYSSGWPHTPRSSLQTLRPNHELHKGLWTAHQNNYQIQIVSPSRSSTLFVGQNEWEYFQGLLTYGVVTLMLTFNTQKSSFFRGNEYYVKNLFLDIRRYHWHWNVNDKMPWVTAVGGLKMSPLTRLFSFKLAWETTLSCKTSVHFMVS